ncbi:FkbM family methyltransferase [Luminiphilus sp.]|nr:FkbM family methyltransferase [Luminiphilus sp.]MDA9625479.1 FkbM family methyltransferase [Luminiphilus sp.]
MNKPFESSAQNFEDVMLYRALGDVETGFYIDVGAQDPIIDSVSKAFFDRGWRGIHIEPVPEYAERLRAARPGDTIIEAAASNEVGTTALTVFPMTGLSTADPLVAKNHIDRGVDHQPEPLIVSTVTLADVAAELEARTVHWLKIDVEGHERAVLEGWDANRLRPWIIVVEATQPNDRAASYGDWEPILLTAGYQCIYNDGLNRFYIEPSREDLAGAFSSPPNPFDDIRLSRHSALCQDVVSEYHAQVLDQQAQMLEQQAQMLEQQIEGAALEAQVQAHEAEITALRFAGDMLTAERDELHTRITAIMESLSWKITGPLRRSVSLIRRVSGGQVGNEYPGSSAPENASLRDAKVPAELTPEARQWAERLRQAKDEASE